MCTWVRPTKARKQPLVNIETPSETYKSSTIGPTSLTSNFLSGLKDFKVNDLRSIKPSGPRPILAWWMKFECSMKDTSVQILFGPSLNMFRLHMSCICIPALKPVAQSQRFQMIAVRNARLFHPDKFIFSFYFIESVHFCSRFLFLGLFCNLFEAFVSLVLESESLLSSAIRGMFDSTS